jgi:polyphosphate:AMP phosphotransferase
MFENAELGQTLDKAEYKQRLPALRSALLEAQRELAEAPFSVVAIVAGMPAAGKSETVNVLLEWLDARGVQTHAMRQLTDEERQRPPLWRYWRDLPAHGIIGIFFGGWDTDPLLKHVAGRLDPADFDRILDRMIELERMLHRENTLVVKYWMHLSQDTLRQRLRRLRSDPDKRWQVTREDRKLFKRYDQLRSSAEHMIRRTSTGEAPWHVIDSTDRHYRNFTAGQVMLEAVQARLALVRNQPPRPKPVRTTLTPLEVNVLNRLDLSQSLAGKEYKKELLHYQGELARLTRLLREAGRSAILVFEGPDAAGKGGAIRRLTGAMDARDYRVISVAAPTDEEKAHPYLWRFWRNLPTAGRVVMYDRSWYGRVLVERVEGFATPEEWQRAYAEINDFETQQIEHGTILVKFWLAICPEEQLRRFEDREVTPYKQYKLTAEDWRNRDRWDAYQAAACEMIDRTSTEEAPWILVEANNKKYARIKVLRTVVERLGAGLKG